MAADLKDKTLPAVAGRALRAAGALLFWLLLWYLASRGVNKELLLPKPSTVALALYQSVRSSVFWLSVLLSILRVLMGFLLGATAGVLLAAATACSRTADALLSPMIRVIRTTPVASFIILAQLWLHTAILPGFIAALMVLPIVWGNLSEGIAKTDLQLLEMGRCYGFSRWKQLRLIYLPSLRPWFRSACTTSLGLAWKSSVAAEVLCQPRQAIGTQLYYSKIYFETEQLFAWTAVVILLSVLLERLLKSLLNRCGGSHG